MNPSQVNPVAVRVHNASRRSSDLDDGSGLLVVRDGGHGGHGGGLVVVRDRGRRSYKHVIKGPALRNCFSHQLRASQGRIESGIAVLMRL